MILVAPSILSADFGNLNSEIASVELFSDLIHVDIMDGHFVPNITFGPGQVGKMRANKPFDVHLMIENPEKYLKDFADGVMQAVGSELYARSFLVVHQEATKDLVGTVRMVKALGMKVGVALNPATSLDTLEDVLDDVDMVLCMTVNPGFGGQKFIESVMPKISQLRALRPDLHIEVDGGINLETARVARQAGANIFVAGNYVFGAPDRKTALESLRG